MDTQRRASVFEILGSWLGIWTPPRDVEVPPFPRRAAAWVAAGLVVVVALIVVFAVPAIDGSKDRRSASDAARERASRAAERARVTRSQRPRTGAAASLLPAAGASEAEQVRARESLLARVQTAVREDAVARARSGELTGRIGGVRCAPVPGGAPLADLAEARGVFDCFVPTTAISETATSAPGQIGYPFRAVVDWRAFRFTWCKVNQIPGEQVIPDPRVVVSLPPACRR